MGHGPNVLQKLNTIFALANTAQSHTIIIPEATLPADTTYIFRVKYKNFLDKQGESIYEFIAGPQEQPIVIIQETAPLIFYTYQEIEILANVEHLKC